MNDRLIAAALGGIGLFAAWLAVPVIQNSLYAQNSIDVVHALRVYELVPESDLRAALAGLHPGEGHPTGDRLTDQAILSLVLAERTAEDNPERERLLADAVRLSERRLERAPRDVHAWTRLAWGEYLLNGPTEKGLAALRRSYEAGPMEYYALWARLRLGVILWPFLEPDLRGLTLEQARIAMRADGGTYRLARIYFKLPEEVQIQLVNAIEGAEEYEDFQRFLEMERERRQGEQ